MTIMQEEHDEWHRKNKGYDTKDNKEHEQCHREMGITVVKSKRNNFKHSQKLISNFKTGILL